MAIRLASLGTETRTAFKGQLRIRLQLAGSARRQWQRARGRISIAAGNAAGGLRIAANKAPVWSARAAEGMARIAQVIGAWLLRTTQIANTGLRKISGYRLPPIPGTVVRTLTQGQSSLDRAVVRARNRLHLNRLHLGAGLKVLLSVRTFRKPDQLLLRRAVPPLLVLLVMVLFVIQEIVTVVKR